MFCLEPLGLDLSFILGKVAIPPSSAVLNKREITFVTPFCYMGDKTHLKWYKHLNKELSSSGTKSLL